MAVPVKDAIKLNFSGGLDLKSDSKQIDASNFLALNNATFTVGGQLTKRNGFAGGFTTTINSPSPSLTFSNVGGSLTAARKLFSFNDELLLNDAFNLYSWDAANLAWNYKGRSTMVALSTASVVSDSTTYTYCDSSIDTTTGIKVFAYYGGTGTTVYYSIQDTTTGQFIVNKTLFGGAVGYSNPRCISIAGKSWITAIKTLDGKIYYQAIVGQTVTGSPTALITNLNATNPFYDIDVDVFSGNIYIAYLSSAGTPAVTISALSTSLVVGNTITKNATATHGVSWFGDGTNIWVLYNDGTNTVAFIVNNAVTSTTASPTNIDARANVNNVTGVWSSTLSTAFIFSDPTTVSTGFTTTSAVYYNSATLSGGTITAGTANLFCGSVNLDSKAFAVSGIPHVVCRYSFANYSNNTGANAFTVIQPTTFLFNLYNVTPNMLTLYDVAANIAAKVSPGEAAPIAPQGKVGGAQGCSLPGVHQNSSGAWELALLQNSNYAFETTPYAPFLSPTGVMDCQFDFSITNPDSLVMGSNALIAGGQVSAYDGATISEQNFHIYPNALLWSSVNTGGGGTHMGLAGANSLYSYIYVYEWVDNQGHVHRSFPSPVLTPLAAGQTYTFASGTTDGTVTLTVPMLEITNKPGAQVVVNIYRTVANGSVYFLLGSPSGLVGTYGTVANNPLVKSVTYIDSFTDDQILANLQLYTTGAQGYFAPPAAKALTNFKNRAIAVPYEGGFDFLYSNQVLPNFPVQFVPFFDQNIGTVGGPLTTVVQMDDKLILFKSGKVAGAPIYYMVGQGPAPSGANNDFQDPLPIALDVGCVDRSSVVLTPMGIIFKSDKGIYLLDRSLQASYIGAAVEGYNQYSVLSSQLIPNTTQVRFLISNGIMLVYDYFYKKWGTWSPPAGISDCIYQGQHTYVSSAGQVYQETPGIYIDGTATPVLLSFTTAWIKLAGLQGYQRSYFFYPLASYISAHQWQFQISYDFASSSSQTTTITPDSTNSVINWRVFLATQRCQAMQIAFTEVYTGTLGQSFNMSGLNLIVGMKNKFQPLPAAQSAG